MNNPHTIPARLHVLFARESRSALVIRRGPSLRTATIGWDRATDTFTLGQWFKGSLHTEYCDLSPHGEWFIYFACGRNFYTAVSRAPYLKALDFYAKGDAWGGGGLFLSDTCYWFDNYACGPFLEQYRRSPLEQTTTHPWPDPKARPYMETYIMRLMRAGWLSTASEPIDGKLNFPEFEKRINDHWLLRKRRHVSRGHLLGKGYFYETHQLIHNASGEVRDYPDWEWADVDEDRLVWAEHGKLMAARISNEGLETPQELHDFNDMVFEERIAPY